MAATSFRTSVVRGRWLADRRFVQVFGPGEPITFPDLHRFCGYVRGTIKRTRDGVRIQFLHLVEVREEIDKDQVEDEVMLECRRFRTGKSFSAAFPGCLDLRIKFGRRAAVRALDKLLAPTLLEILSRSNERNDRRNRCGDDSAARGNCRNSEV